MAQTTAQYFSAFFAETDKCPTTAWEFETATDVHFIDSDFVIELIKTTEDKQAREIQAVLRRLDFENQPILPFLRSLGAAYVHSTYNQPVLNF